MNVILRQRIRAVVSIGMCAAVLAAGIEAQAATGGTPQASITLRASDMNFCYKQDANWSLTKTNDQAQPTVPSPTTVTWTVTATKGTPGPKEICATGLFSVTNSGSAPATIGNIVVNLQRQKLVANKSRWVSASADVADATNGNAATSDKIVATASQEDPAWNAAWNTPATYAVAGSQGTFSENGASGDVEFTDADNNTIWAITPQQVIPVGQTVNLYFTAKFNNDVLGIGTGESLRSEIIVSFGNSGARGGSGASAESIDVNGNGSIDTDEANVRSVPTRITRNLPALQVCNDSVTLTDVLTTSGTAAATVSTNQIGSGVTVNATSSYSIVASLTGGGVVTNRATLTGTSTTVPIQIGTDPVSGAPITVERPCCAALDLSASNTIEVTEGNQPPFLNGDYCTYTQGGYGQTVAGGPNAGQPSGAPALLLWNNFATVYPSGVEVGIIGTGGFSIKFTSASAVAAYLPAGGDATSLTDDLVNPTSTSSGVFGGQVLTLKINVDFSDAHVTSYQTGVFGDLKFANLASGSQLKTWTLTATQAAALNGQTVRQVLAHANTVLGGGALPTYVGSIGDLNQLVTWLNESFDNCVVTAGAVSYLSR